MDAPCLPPSQWIELHNDRASVFPRISIHRAGEDAIECIASREIRVEEVVILSGNIRLPGMLMLPPGKGPFPVVVWNHGSGPVTADAPWDMFHSVRMVEKLGVAVLNYDKRGFWPCER